MKSMKAFILSALAIGTALGTVGCKPEIAEVLEDYCEFQKGCGYVNVNQETQYHNIKTCDRFHRDLLDNTAQGRASGCKDDVTDFFIDFMNAQMDYGCDATLMQTFNRSDDTRASMAEMITCIREKSSSGNSDISQEDVADMGLSVVETLELDLNQMDVVSCETLIGALMPEKVETVCPLVKEGVFINMTSDLCDGVLPMFVAEGIAHRICALFPEGSEDMMDSGE